MAKSPDSMSLNPESMGVFSVVSQMGCKHLDGNLSLQRTVPGLIHLGHASHAYYPAQLVIVQALPAQGAELAFRQGYVGWGESR